MSLVKDFVLYNPLELLLSGSASPTRGKSLTCREDSPNLAVYDRGSETLRRKVADGKSKTCGASAWQSQFAGSATRQRKAKSNQLHIRFPGLHPKLLSPFRVRVLLPPAGRRPEHQSSCKYYR